MWPHVALSVVAALALLHTAYGWAQSVPEVTFLCMPDEPAPEIPPGETDIAGYLRREVPRYLDRWQGQRPKATDGGLRWSGSVLNNKEDLLDKRSSLFSRQLLGQTRIFSLLALFESKYGIRVNILFASWPEAFDQLSTRGGVFVAQMGDTWQAYFLSKRKIVEETLRQWYVDARFFWYDDRLFQPSDFTTPDAFHDACHKLAGQSGRNLVAPFAIPGAPEWDLFHCNSAIEYMFAPGPLVREGSSLSGQPWRIYLTDAAHKAAFDWLLQMKHDGCLAIPDEPNVTVTEDFLRGRYAAIVAPPWVLRWAVDHRSTLTGHIGVAMPPPAPLPGSQEKPTARTFLGGSKLAVFAPPNTPPQNVANERKLVAFLCSREAETIYVPILGFIPANAAALQDLKGKDPTLCPLASEALQHGTRYPDVPEWPNAVEAEAVRISLFGTYNILARIPDEKNPIPGLPEARPAEDQRDNPATQAWQLLCATESHINSRLRRWPPWVRWVMWAVGVLLVVCAGLLVLSCVQRRRIRELRKQRDAYAAYLHDRDKERWEEELHRMPLGKDDVVPLDFVFLEGHEPDDTPQSGGDEA